MPPYAKAFLLTAALGGLLAVLLGAFGAHALKARLDPQAYATYQTAVQYHFWHVLALGLVGLLLFNLPNSTPLQWAGFCMIAGLLLFSGSLYVLTLTGIRGLGMVTPIGGAAWIVGWGLMAWAAVRV